MWLLVSIFDDIGVYGKLMMSSTECHKSHEDSGSPMNRGHRSDFHGEESFSDQYFGLTGEVFGDSRVAHRS